MDIEVEFTITRDSRDQMRIGVRDKKSRTVFLEIEAVPHDLMMALTGLASISAKATVTNLSNIGKKKVIETRSVICPIKSYDRKVLEKWLEDNCQEDGWTLHPSLTSQGSVSYYSGNGCSRLKYSVSKFVEEPIME